MSIKKKIKQSNSFRDQVREVVKKIPKGKTLSYQEVAKLAGSPNACRAVANTMANNFDLSVPCHRVIKKDGSLGGYNRGGPAEKYKLLIAEGWKQD